ncbi:hypothetical protein [Kocuria rhizophila]|uniref:hypothetical protein n=1 Tax=Kocuria rhizophila TaxID=72000 RepID=UPI00119E575D|nr:hypothetical protein [Kocuria rhizophila]MCG7424862.1 hypothetical protein [Kocuria rhizophila]MCT1916247.1 hypothetical protein [Kocuria rhizophila]
MKITQDLDDLQRVRLSYEVGVYDAQPCAPMLVMDHLLSHVVAPRAGLAEAITYLSSSSGPLLTANPLAPASVEVLKGIRSYEACGATNVAWKYSDIHHGAVPVVVDDCLPGETITREGGIALGHFTLHLPCTSRISGSMFALREGWVATNASITGSSPAPSLDRLHRKLGVLLMLSGDLDASGFVIPAAWIREVPEWETYQLLFKTVGLDLTCAHSTKDNNHD